MHKQQQKPKEKKPELTEKEGSVLQKLAKLERTYSVEYEIVKQLTKQIQNHGECDFDIFKYLYNQLSRQIKNTLVFKLLNYKIWNDEMLPVEIREKTQFFKIISEWIIVYELKVGQLKTFRSQIEFLHEFFSKEANNIFQKIVLIDEIHEDLIELLGRNFWGLQNTMEEGGGINEATKQEAAQLLKFLGGLVEYYCFFEKEAVALYNCQLYLLREKSENYKEFIYRSIEYILSVNSGKKSPDKYLDKPQEMELTRIALIFLQRPQINPKKSIALVKMLMLRTSKVVRYAMVVDYVRLYEFLEKSKQYEILEELENMVYFRELIIGQSQISQAGLIINELGKPVNMILVPARTKQRILISHERQFGSHSIFQLEFLIEGGDISITILSLKEGKEVPYWKQDRTEDRRVDILIKEEGLYVIELDNSYSWLKTKKVNYKIEQFCSGITP